MLVSAAMAERPRAAASGKSRTPLPRGPAAQAAPPVIRRRAWRRRRASGASELPGWFWGALGCLTVLVVGLSVVFFDGPGRARADAGRRRPRDCRHARRAAGHGRRRPERPPPTAAAAPRPAIRIEPMVAPPPPAIDQVAGAASGARSPRPAPSDQGGPFARAPRPSRPARRSRPPTTATTTARTS